MALEAGLTALLVKISAPPEIGAALLAGGILRVAQLALFQSTESEVLRALSMLRTLRSVAANAGFVEDLPNQVH